MLSLKDYLNVLGLVALTLISAMTIVVPPAVIVYYAIESDSWLLLALAFVVYTGLISLAVYLYGRCGR